MNRKTFTIMLTALVAFLLPSAAWAQFDPGRSFVAESRHGLRLVAADEGLHLHFLSYDSLGQVEGETLIEHENDYTVAFSHGLTGGRESLLLSDIEYNADGETVGYDEVTVESNAESALITDRTGTEYDFLGVVVDYQEGSTDVETDVRDEPRRDDPS